MARTFDALVIPTGETTANYGGDQSFPVTREAIRLFKTGKYGYIFITGGYSGLAKEVPEVNESEETLQFLQDNKIPRSCVFYDDQSLETMGNFTFPIVAQKHWNPNLLDFKSLEIVAKEGHMWRIRDYAGLTIPDYVAVNYHSIPGEHNNGIAAKVYHRGFMNALRTKVGAEAIHQFLTESHPFYSEGWFDKSPLRRKVETALTGLNWLFE